MPAKKIFVGFVLASVALSASACDTKKKVDRALDNANKLAQEYKRLGENLNKTLADIRASAKTAANQVPATTARVPALPKAVTGGVDVATQQAGKTGTATANIDGLGADENVSVFVPDAATGDSPSTGASPPTLVSWEGDAESEDEGVCYLAWETGTKAWFVASSCGAADGGFVCQVEGEEATCSACNVEGQCNACDLDSEDFECRWPGAEAPANGDPPADSDPPANGE